MESLDAAWSMYHGAALASVALAVGGLFRRIHIAASTTYDQLYPLGTHPVLDPLWSTEGLSFVHDGCEADRIAKTRLAAQSPLALDTLRVCPGHTPEYNCGRCIKCLPTMLDLLQAGALGNCRTLPHEIDVPSLRRMLREHRRAINEENYRRRLASLEPSPANADLRAALAEAVGREADATAPGPPPMGLDATVRRPARLLQRVLRRPPA